MGSAKGRNNHGKQELQCLCTSQINLGLAVILPSQKNNAGILTSKSSTLYSIRVTSKCVFPSSFYRVCAVLPLVESDTSASVSYCTILQAFKRLPGRKVNQKLLSALKGLV